MAQNITVTVSKVNGRALAANETRRIFVDHIVSDIKPEPAPGTGSIIDVLKAANITSSAEALTVTETPAAVQTAIEA